MDWNFPELVLFAVIFAKGGVKNEVRGQLLSKYVKCCLSLILQCYTKIYIIYIGNKMCVLFLMMRPLYFI